MVKAGEQGLEAYLGVEISQDKLSAYVHVHRIDDGAVCTLQELEQWLRSHGIVHGFDLPQLAQITASLAAFQGKKCLVAAGTAPQNGEDGRIELAYDLDHSHARPKEQDDGKVDFREVNQLQNVKRGQVIARKIPATAAIPGTAVTGEMLFGKDGKEARFKIGKNVVLGPDEMTLYAAIEGLVTRTERDKINVFPVYEVNGDVDYKIGNIDFVGTVVIRGNVLSGFRVKAAGDIRVVGGVEGAELETDGSIEITGGILAGNKGYVKAGRNVKMSFVQDGNVIAGEDVLVSQSIMHSHIRAGRDIICSGAKALLVGGMAQAGERVTARTIGNTMSTATVIEVGLRPELRQGLTDLRQQLRVCAGNLDKTDKALVMLDQLAALGKLSPEKLAMRTKLTATKRQAMEEQLSLKDQILELEKTLEETDKARVDAINVVYGGTKIVIGHYTRFVKDPSQRVSFRYADGDIVMLPYH
ncbi:DUF342 domain-containing protein [Paenibacillus daejeonensis]|uniref:DUF342 domain-containing protein n=1 Tax=Paenibacillus daejeonensis TaxID=135193 RepID=UPI000379AA7C|nr:FapA family protein [Paenibacillus daejeonensis]